MAIKRRKKKPRSRKPWELGSEGEETSDGSSSEKVCENRNILFIFGFPPSFEYVKKQHF